VGVATAQRFPNITLSATGGAVAVAPPLNPVAGFALLGASIAQRLFHGYPLVSLDADAQTLRERVEAPRVAKAVYDITAKQYESGGVSLRGLLEARRRQVATIPRLRLLDPTAA
jgi:outer membrane protein TolC